MGDMSQNMVFHPQQQILSRYNQIIQKQRKKTNLSKAMYNIQTCLSEQVDMHLLLRIVWFFEKICELPVLWIIEYIQNLHSPKTYFIALPNFASQI